MSKIQEIENANPAGRANSVGQRIAGTNRNTVTKCPRNCLRARWSGRNSFMFGTLMPASPNNVTFLSWFHLQHRKVTMLGGAGTRVPNMKEFLPDRLARRQFRVHLLTLCLLGPAILWPTLFARPAGLAFALSCVLLMYNLLKASARYRSVSRVLTNEIQAHAKPGAALPG